jgi:hypothetical protein
MSGNSLVVFSDGYPSTVPQPLSVIVVQPSASAPPAQEQTSVAKPLLLELQGDHWVEVATRDRRKLEPSRAREKFRDSQNSPAATVLVFRDGHTELTRSYTIIAGVLFADSDFFSTGAWSRRIPLAALDIAATARANQQRGTVFSLPLAANEVVVNP